MPFRFIAERAADRFWEKVDKTETCWNWTGAKTYGYGTVGYNGKSWRASRLSWFLEYGVVPSEHVLHHCDNPSCVRPSHLFLGDDRTNMIDAREKNRGPKQVLTRAKVREIRAKYVPLRVTRKMLAVQYGVSARTIKHIVNYTTWREICR